jgi:hypothetical protein
VRAFLTRLAMTERVSASTQNQAFGAILRFFREVLRTDLEDMTKTVRAKRRRELPTVLSVAEVQRLLAAVEPEYRLMVKLLHGRGSGWRSLPPAIPMSASTCVFAGRSRGRPTRPRPLLVLENLRRWRTPLCVKGQTSTTGNPSGEMGDATYIGEDLVKCTHCVR